MSNKANVRVVPLSVFGGVVKNTSGLSYFGGFTGLIPLMFKGLASAFSKKHFRSGKHKFNPSAGPSFRKANSLLPNPGIYSINKNELPLRTAHDIALAEESGFLAGFIEVELPLPGGTHHFVDAALGYPSEELLGEGAV